MKRAVKWLSMLIVSAGVSCIYAAHRSSPPKPSTPPAQNVIVDVQEVPQLPLPPVVDAWENVTNTPALKVDIDLKSIKVMIVDDGYRVQSRVRMNFHAPIEIAGQEKKGTYYVNKMSAACKDDSVYVDESIVYDDSDVELARGTNIGRLKYVKDPSSFIAAWVALSCKDLKGVRPPLST